MNDMFNHQVFVDNLNHYISVNNIRKIELAKVIGVSPSTITDWCKKRSYPRMDKIEMLAKFFGVEKSDLIERHDVTNKRYLNKAVNKVSVELLNDPLSVALYIEIQKLSTERKEILLRLIGAFKDE